MSDSRASGDPRLAAFVERILDGAHVPPGMRGEARTDYLDHLRADVDRRVANGADVDQAVADAIAAFGRPADVGRALEAAVIASRMSRDLTNAWRAMRRRPVVSLAAIATLAIGIGVNGAVFSVVDWVLLRPLPYPAAHELVRLHTAGATPVTPPGDVTPAEFVAFEQSRALRSAVGFSSASRTIAGPGIEPAHVMLSRVTGDLATTFGLVPALGRTFTAQEIGAGTPVALLTHALWERVCHRDVAVVGKTVTIDGSPHTVIGVLAPGPVYPPEADLWRPLTADEREDDDRELRVVGRLATGVSAGGASAELSTVARATSDGARIAWVEVMQQTEVRHVERALTALLGAAILILLIACANVAALIAAGGQDRGPEIAVREALGASRAQLVAQLLTETVVLALVGGVAGWLVGRWTLAAIIALAPATLPRVSEIALDIRVSLIGLAATIVVGVVVGIVPAWRASRPDRGMTSAGGVSTRVTRRSNGRRALVLAQVAMAVTLTAGAGLLARSLVNLINAPDGFEPSRLISIELNLRSAYNGDTRQLFRQLTESAGAIPGVSDVSVAMRLPTQTLGLRAPITIAGGSGEPQSAVLRPIGHTYFATAAIALREGRAFASTDRQDAPPVAIVNAAAVRDIFAATSPVGLRITTPLIEGPIEIVGVVDDVTPGGEPDRPALYVPTDQLAIGGGYLLVRTERDPAAVVPMLRDRVRAIVPSLALDRVQLVEQMLQETRAATRFNSTLVGLFALLALVLSAVGVYGLTASEVAARWRELAVRLAVGATPAHALWTVLRPCALVLAAGAIAGSAFAIALAPRLETLLYRVEPTDPVTLASAPILLALIGLSAAVVAAARVLRADPASTLRE